MEPLINNPKMKKKKSFFQRTKSIFSASDDESESIDISHLSEEVVLKPKPLNEDSVQDSIEEDSLTSYYHPDNYEIEKLEISDSYHQMLKREEEIKEKQKLANMAKRWKTDSVEFSVSETSDFKQV